MALGRQLLLRRAWWLLPLTPRQGRVGLEADRPILPVCQLPKGERRWPGLRRGGRGPGPGAPPALGCLSACGLGC